MSYTEKLCGYSYKLDIPKDERISFAKKYFPDKDIDGMVEKWGEDWFYETFGNGRKINNEWVITNDYNDNLGWVYIIDSGESCDDINFKASFTEISEHMETLGTIIGPIDVDNFKAFAFNWYNGCECPLKF